VTVTLRLAVAVSIGFAGCSASPPSTRSATLQLATCTIDRVPAARCGGLEVFENRDAKSGRRIPLRIVVLPAVETALPDPIFFLAGGPGQAATDSADFAARAMAGAHRTRDIVLVDVRGTGGSNSLACTVLRSGSAGSRRVSCLPGAGCCRTRAMRKTPSTRCSRTVRPTSDARRRSRTFVATSRSSAAGDLTPVAAAIHSLRDGQQRGIAFRMHLSVMCAESNPDIAAERVRSESEGTFLGDYRVVQLRDACKEWPRYPRESVA
jgi:hypothetical protein